MTQLGHLLHPAFCRSKFVKYRPGPANPYISFTTLLQTGRRFFDHIASMKPNHFLTTHILFSLLLALMVGGAALTASGGTGPRAWVDSRVSQLVFFAVLEGLYRDGVKNEDVDIIIPPGEHGAPQFDRSYFVYACPLCHPAFEAFRLYRQRAPFAGLKSRADTFGPGLEDAVRAQLRSPKVEVRRAAIQGLITRWVEQRLDLMRLTAGERTALTHEMADARKQGMNMLHSFSSTDSTRTNCPICDGSFGACKLRRE
jgi:hypothetical protein